MLSLSDNDSDDDATKVMYSSLDKQIANECSTLAYRVTLAQWCGKRLLESADPSSAYVDLHAACANHLLLLNGANLTACSKQQIGSAQFSAGQ
jgi:hypothetical protein